MTLRPHEIDGHMAGSRSASYETMMCIKYKLLPVYYFLASLSSAFSCLARFTSSALTPAASAAASVFFSSADLESSISCCALAMRLSTGC